MAYLDNEDQQPDEEQIAQGDLGGLVVGQQSPNDMSIVKVAGASPVAGVNTLTPIGQPGASEYQYDESASPEDTAQQNLGSISMPPSARSAKPQKLNDDGSIQFDNGMRVYKDGKVVMDMGGNTFVKTNPYSKMVHVPTNDPEKILETSAAHKGILRKDFESDAEFSKAAKQALGSSYSGVDAPAIADAVMKGDQPPTLQGLYRNKAAILSELAKSGYNLSHAQMDWNATQKYLSAANSTPVFKMRASAEAVSHSLDVIDDLASQWKAGRYPLLNKANLELAKNGALGVKKEDAEKLASLATQLDAQITDMTFGLGNVYMGGNTPTDQALQLASKNLNSSWDEKVLHDMTNLARKNIGYRLNSLKTVQPAGVGPENKYAQPQSTPSPTATSQPSATSQPQQQAQPDKFETGKVYRDAKGQSAKYLGNGQWQTQ